jgi:integrase
MAKALTVKAIDSTKAGATRQEIPDGLLPGLYLVVQPGGGKSWAVRYRAAGKPRKLTLGPYPLLDLAKARERARDALQTVSLGRDPGAEKKAERQASEAGADRDQFATVVETFLERHARAKTKARSAEETERIFKLHVTPKWGKKRVQEITRRDVLDLLDGLVDAGKPVLANRTLAAVRKFFNWAIERSVITSSPCDRVAAPAAEKSRERVLSDADLRLVWKAAEQIPYPFGPMVCLLVLSGARRDEAAGARWREISQDGTIWTISSERTKNGEAHDVPLSPAAQRLVAGLPKVKAEKKPEFLFTTTGKTPVSGYSNAKERLDAVMLAIARKEAEGAGADPEEEVMIESWRLHDLRRTTASGMARLGIAVHVIEAVLNHKGGAISGVAAAYNRHSYLPEKREALDRWAAHVERLVSGEEDENVVALRR